MENCSATGMGIRIDKEHFKGFLRKLKRGNRLSVYVLTERLETTLSVEVVWLYEYDAFWTLGLRALEPDRMIHFVAAVTGLRDRTLPLRSSHVHLLEHDVRQTAFVLWMLFIALSFGMPAFA